MYRSSCLSAYVSTEDHQGVALFIPLCLYLEHPLHNGRIVINQVTQRNMGDSDLHLMFFADFMIKVYHTLKG